MWLMCSSNRIFVAHEGEAHEAGQIRRERVRLLRDEILCALIFADRKSGHVGARKSKADRACFPA